MAQALRERFGAEEVLLLHSRFLAPDRQALETALMAKLGKPGQDVQRPSRLIVVGTQVLEQSLDIDFDLLITDFCPMDLLLQRIGRLHRHQRPRPVGLEQARCLLLGWQGEGFDSGASRIYGDYLLLRTKALLPQCIRLPQDIPNLVQDTYDDAVPLRAEPEGYGEAKAKWMKLMKDKRDRAEAFRLAEPESNDTLINWLVAGLSTTEKRSEAMVRDTDETIEVLLLRRLADGSLGFASRETPPGEIPWGGELDDEMAQAIARQSIRLPTDLCRPWVIVKTIEELERFCSENIPCNWKESPWLHGELYIILEKDGTARLNEYRLTYSLEDGLTHTKEGDADGRYGV
jgi:CRISPR-associated endonuclease/helicase Cas3